MLGLGRGENVLWTHVQTACACAGSCCCAVAALALSQPSGAAQQHGFITKIDIYYAKPSMKINACVLHICGRSWHTSMVGSTCSSGAYPL